MIMGPTFDKDGKFVSYGFIDIGDSSDKCVCGHNLTAHSVYGHGSKACAACNCG